jgi:hypothetical protein
MILPRSRWTGAGCCPHVPERSPRSVTDLNRGDRLRLILPSITKQAVSASATWNIVAPTGCPYVFMDHGRWDYYQSAVESGSWR